MPDHARRLRVALPILLLLLLAGAFSALAGTLADSPLRIRSVETGGHFSAEVSGLVDYPFDQLSASLTEPAAWCEFLPLVFNIKSCIQALESNRPHLVLYVGRKFYEAPDAALRLNYQFSSRHEGPDHFRVFLFAPEGPFGTSDYRIEVEARADPAGGTFLRMTSSFAPSVRSRLATAAYLATAGRDKIGFSVRDRQGEEAVYVGGMEGIVERNAMRYYLALKAFLDTREVPAAERFEARLNRWYELTQAYPRQLYEMDREEYLAGKRRERRRQHELQGRMGAPPFRSEGRTDASSG